VFYAELYNIPLSKVKWITPRQTYLLQKLKIFSAGDLLNHFPFRYDDRTKSSTIQESVITSKPVTVVVKVIDHQFIYYNKKKHPKIIIQDETTRASLIGFNRQYLKNSLKIGEKYWLNAQFVYKFNEIQASSFSFEKFDENQPPDEFGKILPVYKLTEGFLQKSLRKIIQKALISIIGNLEDEIPEYIRKKHNLIDKIEAINNIHFPKDFKYLQKARLRLAFEEIFAIQLAVNMKRRNIKSVRKNFSYPENNMLDKYIGSLDYPLTEAQKRCINEIILDMRNTTPMHRLLQGDVGSGKTTVAVSSLVLAAENGYQGALMVPTEVLALQHYNKISESLESLGIKTALLTGAMSASEKSEIYRQLENGEVSIVAGTHALFQSEVKFKNLSLIIIDEQHKFGVEQRIAFAEKSQNPDILVMTATPIPRTLTLTVYGDLDVSIIDEMPANRKPVKTFWVKKERYKNMLEKIEKELSMGRQAYFIYPLIEESDKLEIKSAVAMYEKLKRYFKNRRLALVHGRMTSAEKAEAMNDFKDGKIDILVSTTVIEVGIDTPNAVAIVIENCERFGLSQLHQLRGRVGRGNLQSYCFLVTKEEVNEESEYRMQIMEKHNDGFKIAEEDLKLRGPGEILGVKQSGLPEIKIKEFLYDEKLLNVAKQDVLTILKNDPELSSSINSELREGIIRFLPSDYLYSG
jgi:ATP-dependent DNA helicase RecG